jgi:hypothetical protein
LHAPHLVGLARELRERRHGGPFVPERDVDVTDEALTERGLRAQSVALTRETAPLRAAA